MMSLTARDLRARPVRYVAREIVSSAQNHEDVLLFRVFDGKLTGCYIDVGAGDPNWDSVTFWFYKCGWRGINIEANPMFGAAYAHYRPHDINLNIGIGATAGSMVFHRVIQNAVGHGWGLSSFDDRAVVDAKAAGFEVEDIVVPTLPLRDVIRQHAAGKTIDFLKIDVEGLEGTVLASADWTTFRPTVILVEAVQPLTAVPAHEKWEPAVLGAGYLFAFFDGVNAYYVKSEASDLLSQFNAGVNCNDRYRRVQLSDTG